MFYDMQHTGEQFIDLAVAKDSSSLFCLLLRHSLFMQLQVHRPVAVVFCQAALFADWGESYCMCCTAQYAHTGHGRHAFALHKSCGS